MASLKATARVLVLALAALLAAVLLVDGPGAEAAPRTASAPVPASQPASCPGGTADRSEIEENSQARRLCRQRLSTATAGHLSERAGADPAPTRVTSAGRSDTTPRDVAGRRPEGRCLQASLQVFRC